MRETSVYKDSIEKVDIIDSGLEQLFDLNLTNRAVGNKRRK